MRNLVIAFSLLSCSLIGLTFFVGVTRTNPKPKLTVLRPHLYESEKTSIEKIKITVFYFIPKDATSTERSDWKEVTEKHLKRLIDFHALTFKNTSKISYEFFPERIIGEKVTNEYESLFENEDNDALIPVKEEILARVFEPQGAFYKAEEASKKIGIRNVYLVIFEGKGAAGNGDFALISRSYLTDKAYEENGTTFLAHEFYHTLLLPDNYKILPRVYSDNQQIKISYPTHRDIMGQVTTPLPYTYIDTETLKKMGM